MEVQDKVLDILVLKRKLLFHFDIYNNKVFLILIKVISAKTILTNVTETNMTSKRFKEVIISRKIAFAKKAI